MNFRLRRISDKDGYGSTPPVLRLALACTRVGRLSRTQPAHHVLHSTRNPRMISRLHTEFRQEKENWYLEDHSLNGTYLNYRRPATVELLTPGDIICFGHVNGYNIKPGQTVPPFKSELKFIFEKLAVPEDAADEAVAAATPQAKPSAIALKQPRAAPAPLEDDEPEQANGTHALEESSDNDAASSSSSSSSGSASHQEPPQPAPAAATKKKRPSSPPAPAATPLDSSSSSDEDARPSAPARGRPSGSPALSDLSEDSDDDVSDSDSAEDGGAASKPPPPSAAPASRVPRAAGSVTPARAAPGAAARRGGSGGGSGGRGAGATGAGVKRSPASPSASGPPSAKQQRRGANSSGGAVPARSGPVETWHVVEEPCAAGGDCVKPADADIKWVGCDQCEDWYHLLCTRLSARLTSRELESLDFVCDQCSGV